MRATTIYYLVMKFRADLQVYHAWHSLPSKRLGLRLRHNCLLNLRLIFNVVCGTSSEILHGQHSE